jgi:methionyl aminopeptidase
VPVGPVDSEATRLMAVTEAALGRHQEVVRPPTRRPLCRDSGRAEAGFSVVREFVGHGIGRRLHEEPQVPNFGQRDRGIRLREGMVLAIEPMVNAGGPEIIIKNDGWTAVTRDGQRSAHFEHSVAITDAGPFVLSQA